MKPDLEQVEENDQKSENFYVAVPFQRQFSMDSRDSTPSPSPPKNPPPPLPPPPPTTSPPARQKLVSYENIWLDPSNQRPILENRTGMFYIFLHFLFTFSICLHFQFLKLLTILHIINLVTYLVCLPFSCF